MSNLNVGDVVADINAREFELFRKFMLAASGVDLGPTKRALVQARLSRRVAQLGLKNFSDYWQAVSAPRTITFDVRYADRWRPIARSRSR